MRRTIEMEITCCGDCPYYSWKKHRCSRGAHDEGDAQDNFYLDCPVKWHYTDSNIQYLLNYINDFGVENNWGDEHVPEQIRAIFTTWCLLQKINADTKECDEALQILYQRSALEESISYEEFETFMLELIV